MLLRADGHTLFDLHLIGVEASYNVRMSSRLDGTEYAGLAGTRLALPQAASQRPSKQLLARHLRTLTLIREAAVADASYSHVVTTTALEVSRLLEELNAATAELRASSEVPESVATFVEGLADELHATEPHSLGIDPYLSSALFAAALLASKALRHDDEGRRRRELRVALEQLRHVVRDVGDASGTADDVPVKDVLARLVAILAAPQAEVAELLGVSARQLQRWLHPDGPQPDGADAARVRVASQVADQLRHVFTGPGVLLWFRRSHPRLGQPPQELLRDPLEAPRLIGLALAARAQGS